MEIGEELRDDGRLGDDLSVEGAVSVDDCWDEATLERSVWEVGSGGMVICM
jgi:hypothetical protein